MWRKNSVMMTALKVVLSTMMALPAPSMAKTGNGDDSPAGTMEGAPVIFEQIVDAEGRTATLAVVPVLPEQEVEVFDKFIKLNPEGTHLGVASSEDPVFKKAVKSGYFSKIKTFFVGEGEKSPVVQMEERPSVRNRLSAKMKELTERCKNSKMGLISSIAYSGFLGASVWMTSSSVPAGAAVFSMVSLWNAFVLLKPEVWHAAFVKGTNLGKKVVHGVARHYGVEVSDIDLRAGEVVGMVGVTFAVSAAQVALTKAFAGELQTLSQVSFNGFADDLANVIYTGALFSYFLWDSAVLEKFEQAKISMKTVERYLILQYIIGGMLEYAHNQHWPYVTTVLFGLTGLGVLYQMLNIEQKDRVSRVPLKLSFALRNGAVRAVGPDRRALIQRQIGSYRSRLAKTKPVSISGCEIILSQIRSLKQRPALAQGFPQWEDVQ